MKKRTLILKRLIVMCLVVATTLNLVACKGATTDNGAVQKEFVYVPEYVKLEDVNWFNATCGTDEGFYYVNEEWDNHAGTYNNYICYLDGATGEVSRTALNLTEGLEEGSSANIQQMTVLSDGTIAVVVSNWVITNPETYDGVETYFLKLLSAQDGAVITEADITEDISGSDIYTYVQYMVADKDDNIYIVSGDNQIFVFDKTCKLAFKIDTSMDSWIQAMGVSAEGQVVYASWDSVTGGNVINIIDPATRNVSKTCSNNVPEQNGNCSIVPGIESGIIMSSSKGLTEYDLNTETATELLAWLDSDISGDNIDTFTVLADGRVLALSTIYSNDGTRAEAVYLTKTPYAEMPEREILTLGIMYTSQDINNAVVNFNKNNDKYRIQVIDYGTDYSSEEEYNDAITRFNNALTSGNGPDIFNTEIINMSMMAQKGVMEDLNPYLEADADLKREDLFESVLEAYSIDGKLYCIPNNFYVMTVMGKASEVGDTPGWTLDELMALMDSKPEGTEVLEYATKELILQLSMIYNFDSYIDWETGECSFNGEEFVKVLEFADRFVSEEDYSYSEDGPSTPSKIQDGTLMLMNTTISSVQEYQMYSAMFGEPITMIGYPSSEGNGSGISGANTFAVNARSANKEAAWEFIKYLLSEEYYADNNIWGFPTVISEYDKVNAEYMKAEYYEDENGNQVEMSKGSWGWDDFNVELYAATEEEVAAITELINQCDCSYNYDTQLVQIITEEAAPFFEGQKTAQEVADIIQSRVKMYVNENR